MRRSRQGRRVRRERAERAEQTGKAWTRYTGEGTTAQKALTAKAQEELLDARCPVCGGVVVGKGGRWRCVAKARKEFARAFHPGEKQLRRIRHLSRRVLRCAASGTIMQDGSLAVLVGGIKRKEEEDG